MFPPLKFDPMRTLTVLLSIVLALPVLAQSRAKNPNVIVVPYVTPGENEGEQISQIIANDPATTLAMSKIKEEFSLRQFPTIDFIQEWKRVQNRDFAASTLDAKSTGLQRYVENARADIYVTVKIDVNEFDNGSRVVTLVLEAKEAETAFSLANASIQSIKNKASKEQLIEAIFSDPDDSPSENFLNQVKLAFQDMINNGREVNVVVNVDGACDFDMEEMTVGSQDMTLLEELDEWVVENAYKNTGEVRGAGNSINVFMRVPVYDENGKPRTIRQETGKMRRFINELIKSKGYTCVNKAASGQYVQFLIKDGQ